MKAIIISGGQVRDDGFVKELALSGDMLICADSGVMNALRLGLHADICVGDFDSSTPPEDAATEWVTLPTEKDDTDTMSAARISVERGADEVLILAGTGTRLDHTVGNLSVLEFLRQRGIKARLIDENNQVFLAGEGTYFIPKAEGEFLSLLPFCSQPVISVSGVKYPLERKLLPTDQPLGVSNVILNNEATLKVEKGVVAVFLSRD